MPVNKRVSLTARENTVRHDALCRLNLKSAPLNSALSDPLEYCRCRGSAVLSENRAAG